MTIKDNITKIEELKELLRELGEPRDLAHKNIGGRIIAHFESYGKQCEENSVSSISRIVRARIGMIELDRKQISDTSVEYQCSIAKQNELASLISLLENPELRTNTEGEV